MRRILVDFARSRGYQKRGGGAKQVSFTQALEVAEGQTGGTIGSVVSRVGFWVPNTRKALDKVQAAGYPVITAQELPNADVRNGMACFDSTNTCRSS